MFGYWCGGTSDFALIKTVVLDIQLVMPVAGHHVTNDIAIGLQTTLKEAERVKQYYGCALASEIEEKTIELQSIHNGVYVSV